MTLPVRRADRPFRVAGSGEQDGFAARGGEQLGRRHEGRPREHDIGLQDGSRESAEDQCPVPVLGHAGDLDARAQVSALVQLGEDPLPPALHRLLLEERAADVGRDVGRGRHAVDPPAVARAHVASEHGQRPLQPRVDHGLDVAAGHQVLADAVRVVEHVPVGRLLADARPRARQDLGELTQPALHADVADFHAIELPRLAHERRPAEADALPQRIGERPVLAPLELRRGLHPRAERGTAPGSTSAPAR